MNWIKKLAAELKNNPKEENEDKEEGKEKEKWEEKDDAATIATN